MSKFKVGDKVVRVKCSHSKCPIGYVGKVTNVRGCWLSLDEITNGAAFHPFSEDFFELYEEKQMFDFKNTPWVIYVQSKEEAIAAYEWIKKESGMDFSVTIGSAFFTKRDYESGQVGFTNTSNKHSEAEDLLLFGGLEADYGRKVIKLSFKTETTITNVEFPEILTEKEIETKKIREEMESLAQRLKKLEGN